MRLQYILKPINHYQCPTTKSTLEWEKKEVVIAKGVIDDLSEVEDIDLREAFGKLLGKTDLAISRKVQVIAYKHGCKKNKTEGQLLKLTHSQRIFRSTTF